MDSARLAVARKKQIRIEQPDYEIWEVDRVNADRSVQIFRAGMPAGASITAPVRGSTNGLEQGSRVLVSFQKRGMPQVISLASTISKADRKALLLRLGGMWTQWEGGPGLALQPGSPGLEAFIPGSSLWVADQGQFEGEFHFPLLWSSPVLWSKADGQHMALAFFSADSDAEGAPLSFWLEVWGPSPSDYPYLTLLKSTRLAGYPALGGHGISLKLGAPTYDWGGEFVPSRLHYLPSTDQLLILGPGWDDNGRKDVFLCKLDGSLVRKSSPANLLNSVATVAPYAIVTAAWSNVRAVNYLTNAFSDIDEIPRLIRGFAPIGGGEYKERWSKDPFSLLPSGGGIQILKPCNTRASGRNDKRWPYATKSNVIALQFCSGTGITGEGTQSVNFAAPGSPDDRQDVHIWAGAKTTCFTFCSHLIAFLDAETGAYKHQSFDFVTGSNNRLVEEGTLGLSEHGLADGTATTYAYYYGWYPDEFPRTPENIREFVAPSIVVTSYREPLDYPDYNTMGSLPLTFPLSGYNTEKGFGATRWGAGGTVTTAVRTVVGGAFDGQYVGAANYGFNPGFQIGTSGSEQPVNNPGGVFDDEDSFYCRYSMPWIYVRGGNDCEGFGNNYSETPYEVPFDGYIGSTYYTLSSDSIICARVDQHMRTYLKRIPKAPDGKTWMEAIRIEAGQSFDVGTLNADGLYPLTLEHPRSCLEQSWALAPVVGKGRKIQRLLLELIDIRDSLDIESRPLLQVRNLDTLELLGELEVCPVNLATSGDADSDTYPETVAVDGQYLYDSRGFGKPQMRASVDSTVSGQFSEGGAVAHVAIYYSDRRTPGAVVTERFITIVFGGQYPATAPTITTSELDLGPTEDFQIPRNFDTWAQSQARNYYREGNVFSGGS